MYMKTVLKAIVQGLSLVVAFPFALLCGFGRLEPVYLVWAHLGALIPGFLGDFLRIAYYRMTLEECSLLARIDFGSFLPHPQVKLRPGVYIGGYCIVGRTAIGERTHLGSGVQILSGAHQHGRDKEGRFMDAEESSFESVTIGADCWIGAGSIVMAEVGKGCTISAGSVVTRPIPPGSVAAGNPARVLQTADAPQ
jgi:virginiamycin A acetyltransferase